VATAIAGDEEMKHRITEHQKARPRSWSTLETTMHIGSRIEQNIGESRVVIVDCITLLISNLLGQCNEEIDHVLFEKEVTDEVDELIGCTKRIDATFIIVTNEVGMGLVPVNRVGRLYRDLLGKANQTLARQANEVYLMVAGIPLKIKP